LDGRLVLRNKFIVIPWSIKRVVDEVIVQVSHLFRFRISAMFG
jgi:hypothetical protein